MKFFTPASWIDKSKFFTDGSKINDRVDAAFVIYLPDGSSIERMFRLPDVCSVFKVEVVAIQQSAFWLCQETFDDIVFFVDSQAALLSLRSEHVISKTVVKAIEALNRISGEVNFVWVKSHSWISGNEAADVLAKTAANLPTVIDNPIPKEQVKTLVLSVLHDW